MIEISFPYTCIPQANYFISTLWLLSTDLCVKMIIF